MLKRNDEDDTLNLYKKVFVCREKEFSYINNKWSKFYQ